MRFLGVYCERGALCYHIAGDALYQFQADPSKVLESDAGWVNLRGAYAVLSSVSFTSGNRRLHHPLPCRACSSILMP